jgi:Fe-S oxidoreductase
MGLIYWWARVASHAPRLVNAVTHAPLLSRVVKSLGGVAQAREMPTFAPETFKQWFRRRGPRNAGRPRVLLWPDTFNNHFHPQTAIAATEVLEAAGFQVIVPEASLCCGRPLYDFGMLETAKRQLRQILETLRPEIEAGVPIVGLEPSCVSVFRDELRNLFPNDQDAQRLTKQTFLLSEFLVHHADGYEPPTLNRAAVVHGHCHHKSVLGFGDEETLLNKMGLDYHTLDSGCCGMAGAFGFEREHYDVSVACGERVLLPAVREAPKDAIILTDGFSCREQIAQTTGRTAMHLAQVLRMALSDGPSGPTGGYPEVSYAQTIAAQSTPAHNGVRRRVAAAGAAVSTVGVVALVWTRWRRRSRLWRS